jgi:hypothetical protein
MATEIPEKARLLSFGCEFGASGVPFIFLIHCEEDFAGLSNVCDHADDKKEAAVLDYIEEDDIMHALGSEQWTPNRNRMITNDPKDPNPFTPGPCFQQRRCAC